MLTLETKVARELTSIDKLKHKLDIRTEKIRRLLNNSSPSPIVKAES
jgi:hypothetical protein